MADVHPTQPGAVFQEPPRHTPEQGDSPPDSFPEPMAYVLPRQPHKLYVDWLCTVTSCDQEADQEVVERYRRMLLDELLDQAHETLTACLHVLSFAPFDRNDAEQRQLHSTLHSATQAVKDACGLIAPLDPPHPH